MSEVTTKICEYVGNRTIFLSKGTNLTAIVRGDDGVSLVEIDVDDLLQEAVRMGFAKPVIKYLELDCKDEISDAIHNHMDEQPTAVVCHTCGVEMNFSSKHDYSGGNQVITVDACKHELMEQKIDAQRKYCVDNEVPFFAQRKVCSECKKPWALCGPGEKLTLKDAGSMHITGCPHCPESWSD